MVGSDVGLEVDLEQQHVILDYCDGMPRLVAGRQVAPVAVAAVADRYGVEALVTHSASAGVRR